MIGSRLNIGQGQSYPCPRQHRALFTATKCDWEEIFSFISIAILLPLFSLATCSLGRNPLLHLDRSPDSPKWSSHWKETLVAFAYLDGLLCFPIVHCAALRLVPCALCLVHIVEPCQWIRLFFRWEQLAGGISRLETISIVDEVVRPPD